MQDFRPRGVFTSGSWQISFKLKNTARFYCFADFLLFISVRFDVRVWYFPQGLVQEIKIAQNNPANLFKTIGGGCATEGNLRYWVKKIVKTVH